MNITYDDILPVTDYNNLRDAVGWGRLTQKQAETGIKNSAYVVAAKEDGKTIGMARVISDGGYVYYIADVVVYPDYQGNKIGKTMMQMIMIHLNSLRGEEEKLSVNLMAAKGREDFYKQFGFIERPNEQFGAGMCQWIEGKAL